MSSELTYNKVVRADILTEAIKFRTSLKDAYIGTSTLYRSNDNIIGENQASDIVTVKFNRALTSLEQDEITNIVNALGPTYDLQIRKDIEENVMSWAMIEGKNILAQFAANNLYRQKTALQIDALLSQHCELIESLLTGSLTNAYVKFSTMTADENMSQEEIDEFKLRLEDVLGI